MTSRRTKISPKSGRGLGHVTSTIFGSTVGYPSDSLASCYILFLPRTIYLLGNPATGKESTSKMFKRKLLVRSESYWCGNVTVIYQFMQSSLG